MFRSSNVTKWLSWESNPTAKKELLDTGDESWLASSCGSGSAYYLGCVGIRIWTRMLSDSDDFIQIWNPFDSKSSPLGMVDICGIVFVHLVRVCLGGLVRSNKLVQDFSSSVL